MATPLEIAGLQKIMVKPTAWRMVEHGDGSCTLEFTYVDPSRGEWAEVRTRRGEIKRYKHADTALADIGRVQPQSVIYFHSLVERLL